MKERLQKLISMAGIASRRSSEAMITAGRVRVNGKVAKVGDQADLATDIVEVDGVKLNTKAMQARVYYAIYKPRNVLASKTERHDDERKTVFQFVPYKGHLFSIGRLDADSDGLVVLTNDGEMAQKLSHPRYKHTKTYRVVVEGLPTADTLERWENGIVLEEGRTAPCFVKVAKGDVKESTLHVVMTEGKKRQIRRVASILGHPVIRLTRTAIGQLELGRLKAGEFRALEPEDIEKLQTPAVELKAIRARRAARYGRRPTGSTTEDVAPPSGTGRNDDVRSERQRRSARSERGEGERPNHTGDATPIPGRPRVRPAAQAADQPSRPYRRRPEAQSDDAEDRPRRPARRPGGSANRPSPRPSRGGSGRPASGNRKGTTGRPASGSGVQRPTRRPKPGSRPSSRNRDE